MNYKNILEKLRALELKCNAQFKGVYDAINYLLNKDKQEIEQRERRHIGFRTKSSDRKYLPMPLQFVMT